MIISWEQIRQVVQLFSDNHIMIKRFYSDFEDQLSTYSTLGEDFPVLYMTPVDGNMGYTQNSLNIRFYCFDRIIRDRSNWNGVVSDCHRCLNDLYKFLQSPSVELIDTELEASITPINDAFMDYVAGWYMDVDISLDTYSDCFIMIDDVPVFSWSGTFGLKSLVKYHGSFYDTTTQVNLGATYSNLITFNNTDISKGVSIQNGSQIVIEYKGVYDIQFSAQMDKTDSGKDSVEIWLRKNGQNVPHSATVIELDGNNAKQVASWNFFVSANDNDYYELAWHSNDTHMRILARAAQVNPDRPEIPSVILTVNKVD